MSRITFIRQSAFRMAAVVAVAGLVAGAKSASAGNGIYFGGNVSFNPQPEPPESISGNIR